MSTIWKFELSETGVYSYLEMPKKARILAVQNDNKTGKPCLWAIVNPKAPREDRIFVILGTGSPMGEGRHDYVGTIQGGPFVWHVFETDETRGGE